MRGHQFKKPRRVMPKALVAGRRSAPARSRIDLPHCGECVVEFRLGRNGRLNARVFQVSRLPAV